MIFHNPEAKTVYNKLHFFVFKEKLQSSQSTCLLTAVSFADQCHWTLTQCSRNYITREQMDLSCEDTTCKFRVALPIIPNDVMNKRLNGQLPRGRALPHRFFDISLLSSFFVQNELFGRKYANLLRILFYHTFCIFSIQDGKIC